MSRINPDGCLSLIRFYTFAQRLCDNSAYPVSINKIVVYKALVQQLIIFTHHFSKRGKKNGP
jgi:hypothetical protein